MQLIPRQFAPRMLEPATHWSRNNGVILEFTVRGYGPPCITYRLCSMVGRLVVFYQGWDRWIEVHDQNLLTAAAMLAADCALVHDARRGTEIEASRSLAFHLEVEREMNAYWVGAMVEQVEAAMREHDRKLTEMEVAVQAYKDGRMSRKELDDWVERRRQDLDVLDSRIKEGLHQIAVRQGR